MRVLMICPELPRENCPGSMAATARQFQSLRELGIDIDIVDMHGIPKLKYLQAIPKIYQAAKQADLVHAHFGYCGWLGRLQFKKPLVMSFMGSDVYGDAQGDGQPSRFSEAVAYLNRNLLARTVTSIIVKSQMMADLIAPLPAVVIPNGVDVNLFRPIGRDDARRELGWDLNRRYLLFPGNPANPRKGYMFAQQVLQNIQQHGDTDVELVALWGVAPDQVPVVMNACNAMLMVSFAEGSPNVVKEALACNVPVIATPVGDVQELLAGATGYTVCSRKASDVADAVLRQFADTRPPAGRQRIAERRLDLQSVAIRVVEVYGGVLGSESSNLITT